jgi:hypothetical protein
MWLPRLVAFFLLLTVGSGDPIYNGPKRLGAFDVVRPTPIKTLLQNLGDPVSHKSPFCYGYGETAYLRISAIHEQTESAGELLISGIPNCSPNAIVKTARDFRSWKTAEGIGLGSPRGDVLKSYGNPTRIQKPDHELFVRFFSDYASKMRNASPIAQEVLLYNGVLKGLPNSWTSARFGIQDDKVAWIMLTIDD